MDLIYYLYITLAAAAIVYIALLVFKIRRKKKQNKKELEIEKNKVKENLNIVDDVRYTMEDNPLSFDGKANATYKSNDIVLQQNTPVIVNREGEVKPGKYIIISTDENMQSFNIRVGIYVREYQHNQEIVLAEGDTICAVSGNVILR